MEYQPRIVGEAKPYKKCVDCGCKVSVVAVDSKTDNPKWGYVLRCRRCSATAVHERGGGRWAGVRKAV